MKNTVNLKEEFVPFEELSLPLQYKCIELYGHPYELQSKDNSTVDKNHLEKDTQVNPCVVESKLQIPEKTTKILCRICSKLSTSTSLNQSSSFRMSENKKNQQCFCQRFVLLNQLRKAMGAPQISHNQVCKMMRDFLKDSK